MCSRNISKSRKKTRAKYALTIAGKVDDALLHSALEKKTPAKVYFAT